MINRRRLPAIRIALIAMALLIASQLAISVAGAASREVHFDGRAIAVSRSWPVYRLAEHPGILIGQEDAPGWFPQVLIGGSGLAEAGSPDAGRR